MTDATAPDTPPTGPTGNRLAEESSPYLLQHVDNPVHWMAWGEEAFARARTEDKPILLSVGYAACHWCHVMAHESFEDGTTADLMNERFVNIKVDREERPDVDAIYQNALALLGEQGGWPLTMFLTPKGDPFWGGTYFPPEDRWGRPAFKTVLTRISDIYRNESDKIDTNVDALKDALGKVAANKPGGPLPPGLSDQIADHFAKSVDMKLGGMAGAPKFPQPSVFSLLWRAWRRTGDERYRDAVTVTLDRMSQGGIYDHLGGGYARYSTDAMWLAPHFEKMLYDNAQLIELLTLVWQELGTPLYEIRVRETIDWLLREMTVEGADGTVAFAGTLDADSEGEEGKFYVWSADEIDEVLGADADLFKQAYDVTAGGNWEGKTILNRSAKPDLGDPDHEAFLGRCRTRLLERRAGRIRPGLDDKVLADWNGLAISALAAAGSAFGEDAWIDTARNAFAFVEKNMIVDGRVKHSWRAGAARHPGTLEDYAALAGAALALHDATQDATYLERAKELAADIEDHFADGGQGYFLSADDVDDVILRTKPIYDNATPSGNGLLLHVLARLYYLTGNDGYRARADALVKAFSGELERSALGMPMLVMGNELLTHAVQVAIVGPVRDDAAAALVQASRSAGEPNLVLQRVADGAALPEGHPAHGKTAVEGAAAAYVCRGTLCTLPITEPEKLAEELSRY